MRKIEKVMLSAISERRNWKFDNTEVVKYSDGMGVFLFGNHIATVGGKDVEVNKDTVRAWPSNTTLSRLRVLGVSVRRVNGEIRFDDTDG